MRIARSLSRRRGAIAVLAAACMIVVLAMAAFTVDLSVMSLASAELQSTADAAALAGIMRLNQGNEAVISEAKNTASLNSAVGNSVTLSTSDIEFGRFDMTTRQFTVTSQYVNAIRVTARLSSSPYFFAPIMGRKTFSLQRSAVAMVNPRDIVFCVDLSGSMNDDTECCWATSAITSKITPSGYPLVAGQLMQQVYTDFGYGAYPGTTEYVGAGLGVAADNLAYAEMTKDSGPLTATSIASKYRISNSDAEATRKTKCYSWIIDVQITRAMPQARPTPNSSDGTSFNYWSDYLDYIMEPRTVGGGYSSISSPTDVQYAALPNSAVPGIGLGLKDEFFGSSRDNHPSNASLTASIGNSWLLPDALGLQLAATSPKGVPRQGLNGAVTLPPTQDTDNITDFNNPNTSTFPTASSALVTSWRNRIGYATYVQFMMDWGRDRSPTTDNSTNSSPSILPKVPLSILSPYCPYHNETTAGGTFSFPPSEQPTHSLRRALIAAIDTIRDRNTGLNSNVADWVSVVTFDALDTYHSPTVVRSLTADYTAAMSSCTKLQAVGDINASTATQNGLITANAHIQSPSQGGSGRDFATKVCVLLTDGVPNVWSSSTSSINQYISANPNPDYYSSGYVWYNSALMQVAMMQSDREKTYGVGIGLGCDYDFMDRVARMGTTAEKGLSPRGSGNPADYEARLVEIFQQIIDNRGGRLVK